MPLSVGDRVPDVSGTLPDGSTWKTSDARGKPLVVYFYPKDFTPGCTREACAFRDSHNDIVENYGAEVVGISRDTAESHEKFAERHNLPYKLVADPTGELTKAFKATMFLGLLPVSRRVTYVADGEGVIRGVFDHQAAAERHVDEVRDCLEQIVKGGPHG
ncbi:MAG TPA: peroxiredoxin [Blastocatellia bacterium]|nr:peroxiredoxin [Blastocatellia bacterium]